MGTEKDVLGKADALLKRHSTATGSETGAFPVLTDIVDETLTERADHTVPVVPVPPQAPATVADAFAPEVVGDLAAEVFKRVMAEVEGRLAIELERRLTEHLVPQVHAAVSSAIGDLHQELANAIGDAVAAALAKRTAR